MAKKKITPKDVRVNILHMTQGELGFKLGISNKTISNKECGRRSWSAKEIIKIAKLAKIDPSDIFLLK